MSLVININSPYQLKDYFKKFNRDYYTISGYEKIIEFFNEFEKPIELDIIGICCDFSEETYEYIIKNYSNFSELDNLYNKVTNDIELNEEDIEQLLDFLNYHSIAYCTQDGMILYKDF